MDVLLFRLGINHQIPGGALIALDDACRGRVTHTYYWTSALSVISSVMILKANVEMLPSIKRAIYTSIA